MLRFSNEIIREFEENFVILQVKLLGCKSLIDYLIHPAPLGYVKLGKNIKKPNKVYKS